MKKSFITGLLMWCAVMTIQAQEQIRVFKDGESKRFTTSEILFSEEGTSFSVGDSTYNCTEIDSITVVHTVTVTFAGDTAYVDYGHARNVTDTIHGAHVKLISTNTKNELEFVLQGESTHGSLTYDGPLKCKFYLNGLNLKSDQGAALDIKCGKRIDLILKEGTENFLADAAGGTQKAALHCKGHLEVSGGGSLTITGNAKHGIDTKEYMEIKKSTGAITINKAISDAMHIGQYFKMNGGTLDISGQAGDGIQVEIATLDDGITPNPDKENNGLAFIRGGNINIAVTGACSKGIKVPKDLTVSGGNINQIVASGAGSRGIQVEENMLVNEDTGTTLIQVRATGGVYENEDEDEWRCMAIKVDGNLTVDAGTIRVSNTGSGSRGIRIHGTYTKNGGTVSGSVKVGD